MRPPHLRRSFPEAMVQKTIQSSNFYEKNPKGRNLFGGRRGDRPYQTAPSSQGTSTLFLVRAALHGDSAAFRSSNGFTGSVHGLCEPTFVATRHAGNAYTYIAALNPSINESTSNVAVFTLEQKKSSQERPTGSANEAQRFFYKESYEQRASDCTKLQGERAKKSR